MYCKSLLTCKTLVSHTFMRLKTCKENIFVKTMNTQHTQDQFWRTAHQIKDYSMPKIFEINLNTVLFIGFNIWNLTKQTACCPRMFIKKGLHQILRIRPIKHHNRYHLLVTCKMTGDWTYPLEKTKQYHKTFPTSEITRSKKCRTLSNNLKFLPLDSNLGRTL